MFCSVINLKLHQSCIKVAIISLFVVYYICVTAATGDGAAAAGANAPHIYNAEFKEHYSTTKKSAAAIVSPPTMPNLPLVIDDPNGLNAGGSANDIDNLLRQLGV